MTILADLRTRTRGWHPPSLFAAAAYGVLAALCVAALLVDHRTVEGAPTWVKPLKFAISGGLYFLTWSWLVSLLPRFRRTAAWLSNTLVLIFAGEYVLLVFQAARGRASHFNNATPLDATIYDVMGKMIIGLWVATLVLTVLVMVTEVADRASFWAVRAGAVLSLAGISLGVLMTIPTARQLAQWEAGGAQDVVGAHSVGLADGGPGLPLLGWSTAGGDLRIPHFVGMHALQALPLLAITLLALASRFPRLRDDVVRARLILIGAAGYAGLIALVTWQALRAQSIVHPDAVTLSAAAVLVAAVGLSAWAVVRAPARVAVG
jgi:multisubunit Na+/H+ antiporter MnhB subunit